jgi:hypothetical protein
MKLLVLMLFLTVLSAQNEPTKAQAEPLISAMTVEKLQAIVQAMGFECTRGTIKDGKPDNFFSFRARETPRKGAGNCHLARDPD